MRSRRQKGLALMALAEALLRVPDSAIPPIKFIEDKLESRAISPIMSAKSDALLDQSASGWALGVTARLIQPGQTPESLLGSDRPSGSGLPAVQYRRRVRPCG